MKLSDLVTISAGYPFRGKIIENPGAGTRAVQMKDVSVERGIFWDSVIETKLSGKKQPDCLRDGDILFVARGMHNYAVLVEQVMGQVVSAPHFFNLRVNEQPLLPEFLVWQLNQKPLQNYFNKAAQGSMTKSIQRATLENAKIIVPSLEKQKKTIRLYRTLLEEKNLYAQLSNNANQLMNSIAKTFLADEVT